MKLAVIGGHLAPALAVIQSLPRSTEVIYIGRRYALEGDKALSLEFQTITALNITFTNLQTGRFQRKFTARTIPSLFKIPVGFFQAFQILYRTKPDAILGFGGYLQIPIIFTAFVLGIPVILHEQTLRAGLANKLCSYLASAVCISWGQSSRYFPSKKTILTGLPLRKEFFRLIPRPHRHQQITLYITGGSLGAHALNVIVENCLRQLLEKYYIIHQTGDAREYGDFERLEKLKKSLTPELQNKYKIYKFIDPSDTAETMNQADIVIARSGINTTAELIFLNKPCLLIPLPHGQNNEQLENALFIQKLGLGKILHQNELTPQLLYSQITELTAKLKTDGHSARPAKKLFEYDAAKKIIEIIFREAKQKKQPENQKSDS